MRESERWYDQLALGRSKEREAVIFQRFESLVIGRSLVNSSTDILSSAFDPSSSKWDTLRVM